MFRSPVDVEQVERAGRAEVGPPSRVKSMRSTRWAGSKTVTKLATWSTHYRRPKKYLYVHDLKMDKNIAPRPYLFNGKSAWFLNGLKPISLGGGLTWRGWLLCTGFAAALTTLNVYVIFNLYYEFAIWTVVPLAVTTAVCLFDTVSAFINQRLHRNPLTPRHLLSYQLAVRFLDRPERHGSIEPSHLVPCVIIKSDFSMDAGKKSIIVRFTSPTTGRELYYITRVGFLVAPSLGSRGVILYSSDESAYPL